MTYDNDKDVTVVVLYDMQGQPMNNANQDSAWNINHRNEFAGIFPTHGQQGRDF